MSSTQFYDLVRRMRTAQREFFRTRSREILAQSKSLEAQVDKELLRASQSNQPSLFNP